MHGPCARTVGSLRNVASAAVVAFVALTLPSCGSGSGSNGSTNGSGEGGAGNDAAAGASSGGTVCAPGRRVSCACPATTLQGVQSCNSDGMGYGACAGCPDAGGGSSGGSSGGASSGGSSGTVGGSSGAFNDGGTGSSGSYDQTTGNPCTTNADCRADGGAGVNVCTDTLGYQVATNSTIDAYPTPICIVPPGTTGLNCDPAPSSDPTGQYLHYCDGPDDPSSLGVCVPVTNPATRNQGECLPQCTFTFDGSAPYGCTGSDTCVEFAVQPVSGAPAYGVGYCRGTCTADSDCSGLGSTFTCDTITGSCTTKPLAHSKALGAACTASDSASGACNCLTYSSTTGYCSSACVIGGPNCPNGWVCDSLEPAAVPDGAGGAIVVPGPSPGAAGYCVVPCTTDDAGASICPGALQCGNATAAGPDCLP